MKLICTVICTALFIGGCNSKPNPMAAMQGAAPPAAKIQAFVVAEQELAEDISVSGTLVPNEETALHPEISGRVVRLPLQEGAHVAKGTLLCKLFDGDILAQLKKVQVQLATARKTEQRQRELLALNGSSSQEADMALLQVQTLEADSGILAVQLSKTEIRAPFSGTVGLSSISVGAYTTPATSIARIQQVQPLKLDFSIPERYGSRLGVGSVVSFRVDGSRFEYSARVIAFDAGVNAETRNRVVRAQLVQPSNDLVPGMFASVRVPLGNKATALMVPSKAIIPQARDKKVIVIKNGIAVFTTVTTGTRTQDAVEITSGVAVGDTIATSGIMFIKPNTKVTIAKVNSAGK